MSSRHLPAEVIRSRSTQGTAALQGLPAGG